MQEVGAEVSAIKPGDRVVIPLQVSCGHCFMCDEQLYSRCETMPLLLDADPLAWMTSQPIN